MEIYSIHIKNYIVGAVTPINVSALHKRERDALSAKGFCSFASTHYAYVDLSPSGVIKYKKFTGWNSWVSTVWEFVYKKVKLNKYINKLR